MAGWVAGAIVGGALIGGVTSSSAARAQARAAESAAETQSDAAIRVAEIETQAAREAADIQAEAFRQAAAAQEAGISTAAGIEAGLGRVPGPITQAELGQFNQAVASGDYATAARLAASANVPPETVAAYLNQNAANLNLPGPVSTAQVSDLMSTARIGGGGISGGREIEARAAEQAASAVSQSQLQAAQQQAAEARRVAEELAAVYRQTGDQQSAAALEAARIQAQAAQEQVRRAEQTFAQQQQLLGPFQQAGVNALSRIQAGLAPGGEFAQPFTADRFQADPGYAFRLSEGQKALERQSAARGGLMSGAALKAATRFGQEMGSQEFQNAFNRYYAERAAVLNPLMDIYGTGYGAAGQLSGAAGTMGSNIANYLGTGARAQAAGVLDSANALADAARMGQQTLGLGSLSAAELEAMGLTSGAQARAQGILGAGAARTTGYLDELQARAQAQRDIATTRASGYTGPAQFQAQGILGAGRATAGGQQQSAAALSQGLLQSGQARAAGQLGIGNALTSAIGTGVNLYQQQQLLNRLYPVGGTIGAPAINPTMGNFPAFSFG